MSFDFNSLDERVQKLLSRFGAAACGAEVVCDGDVCGHITAAARVYNLTRTRILKVWSAKNERWQLPGAHGENNLDLRRVAQREARHALGLPVDAELSGGEIVDVETEEIAEYWNTPAHTHFTIIHEFRAEELIKLPRGARWFDIDGKP